jgi:hypothetical protein
MGESTPHASISETYPKDFIETTFLGEYKNIIYTHKYHHIGFALVCIGIEFLGKCLDAKEQDWQKRGLSAAHFKDAIEQTMPKYKACSTLLYEQLRSGFAHGLLPGPKVGLTHRDESVKYGTAHLFERRGTVTVVIESLYDDFEAACRGVLQRQFPQNDKMSNPLLAIPSDSVAVGELLNARATPY